MISMSTRWNNGVITPLGWPRKALNELEEMAGENETGLLCLDCWMDGWMDIEMHFVQSYKKSTLPECNNAKSR